MRKVKLFLILSVVLLTFSFCSKVEGPGGSITVRGVVIERDHVGINVFEYPAPDQDVYLIYGSENTFYDDDIKTSYDGSFEFRYLQKGDYQIFAYSDVNPAEQTPDDPSATEEVLRSFNLSDKKQVITLDTIYIEKY